MKISISYIMNLATECDFLNLSFIFLDDMLDVNMRPLRHQYGIHKAVNRTAQSKQPHGFLLG